MSAVAGVAQPLDRAGMIDLFGDAGRAALRRLAAMRPLYAFDFDGTLAPIVARPTDARARPETTARLAALTAVAPVAVLTGRGVDDLRSRIDFEPAYVVGNHGAEGLPGRSDDGSDHRAVVAGWLGQWPDIFEGTGVVVEAKAYSLSIHYRAADDPAEARRAIEAAIGRMTPRPRVIGGKCVFNLLPEGGPDKGHALVALLRHAGCDAAFFIGDDLTDEAAFAVARDDWVTVHVGDAPDSAARYVVPAQEEIDRCLALLLECR